MARIPQDNARAIRLAAVHGELVSTLLYKGARHLSMPLEATQLQDPTRVTDNSNQVQSARLQSSLTGMIICPQCKTANPDFAESCSRCSTPMPIGDSETIQMVDPTTITPGSDFGPRYRIEALLGQGGMGRVYKAYDKELNRTVAIKVVRQGVMGEADALSRFKQELVLASKISHKNILRIHDLGEVSRHEVHHHGLRRRP